MVFCWGAPAQLFKAHIDDCHAFVCLARKGLAWSVLFWGLDSRWQWHWLQYAKFTRETECLIFAAQEKVLTTNVMRANFFDLDHFPLCHLCNSADETVDHLVSSCSYIAQTEYKRRYDQVAFYIHWNRPESNMLEILPKMLLGISQNLLLLCSFSVLLCLHYARKLVRFVTIF